MLTFINKRFRSNSKHDDSTTTDGSSVRMNVQICINDDNINNFINILQYFVNICLKSYDNNSSNRSSSSRIGGGNDLTLLHTKDSVMTMIDEILTTILPPSSSSSSSLSSNKKKTISGSSNMSIQDSKLLSTLTAAQWWSIIFHLIIDHLTPIIDTIVMHDLIIYSSVIHLNFNDFKGMSDNDHSNNSDSMMGNKLSLYEDKIRYVCSNLSLSSQKLLGALFATIEIISGGQDTLNNNSNSRGRRSVRDNDNHASFLFTTLTYALYFNINPIIPRKLIIMTTTTPSSSSNSSIYIDASSLNSMKDIIKSDFQQALLMMAIYHRNCLPYCYTFTRKFGSRVRTEKHTIHDWLALIDLTHTTSTTTTNLPHDSKDKAAAADDDDDSINKVIKGVNNSTTTNSNNNKKGSCLDITIDDAPVENNVRVVTYCLNMYA
jgi:hypothetical protein